MKVQDFGLQIIINNKPIKEYQTNSSSTKYVESRDGSRFKIRLKNFYSGRALARVSVDGLCILSGEPTVGIQPSESQGYIIPARGFVDIEGWRLNDDNVAAFEFGKLKDSYAQLSGKEGTNSGWIQVEFFRETWAVQTQAEWLLADVPRYNVGSNNWSTVAYPSSTSAGSWSTTTVTSGSSSSTYSVTSDNTASVYPAPVSVTYSAPHGTKFGEETYQPVVHTEFRTASSLPDEILSIRYAPIQTLKELGFVGRKPKKKRFVDVETAKLKSRYCMPPKGYKSR